MLPLMTTVAWLVLSCLVFQSHVKGEDLQNEELLPRIWCPQHSFAYDNRCYAVYMSPKSWTEAALECKRRPYGNLVSVLTSSEADFVATLIKDSNTETPLVWIGFRNFIGDQISYGWEWISGELPLYIAWDYDMPTGSGSCGAVSYRSGYKYWQRYDCTKPLPYVCKFRY